MANYMPTTVNPCPPTYSNFVDGMDIGELIHRNAYDVAVQEEPRALEATFMRTDGCATEVRVSRRTNIPRSSSMYCSTIEAPAPLPHITPDCPNPQVADSIEPTAIPTVPAAAVWSLAARSHSTVDSRDGHTPGNAPRAYT
jgi:hypothetical protein